MAEGLDTTAADAALPSRPGDPARGERPPGADWESDAEAQLILAARRGEHEALRALWDRHRRWVATVVLAHKPREADLDDLLQEIAVALVRRVAELRDPGAFKPWLRTVAINAARLAARGPARRRLRLVGDATETLDGAAPVRTPVAGAEAGPDGPPPPATGPTTVAREEGNRLMDLASRLPDGYREPLLMKALRDMSYRQIGAVLDLPETTVETRIARARRMLRELASQTTPARAGGPENTRAAAAGAAGEVAGSASGGARRTAAGGASLRSEP